MQTYRYFELDIAEGIAHVRINNPKKANALDLDAWHELGALFGSLNDNSAVRVVILSGNGKHFCSGIDLMALLQIQQRIADDCEGRKREKLRQVILHLQQAVDSIAACAKPVIAAVHGGCIGGGLDIAAACDMRFAAEGARFSLREVDLAIVADLGSLQRLPHIVSEGVVREMAFTGGDWTADEARAVGLVNRVLADEAALHAHVATVAQRIAAQSPLTVRGIKAVMQQALRTRIAAGLDYTATWNAAMMLSEDLNEAVASKMQQRPATFKD